MVLSQRCLLISVLLTLNFINAQNIPTTIKCTCAQITVENECVLMGTCSWLNGSCLQKQKIIPPRPTFCSSISRQYCASTPGCAFTDGMLCVPFTGCTNYLLKTDKGCQSISNQCTTNGVGCIKTQACSSYSVSQCGLLTSSSGTGTCKLANGICSDQICSDAQFTTDQACATWLTGCLSTGVGCVAAQSIALKPSCTSYQGTQMTCENMLGREGKCKYISGEYCIGVVCSDAPLNLNTDQQCSQFLENCKTNNKGCVTSLQPCKSYTYDLCNGYIGSDGTCITDTITKTCRLIQCSDNTTGTTNSVCNQFKSGCITNGQGCTEYLSYCNQYTGTITSCAKYIGFDGNCKGTSLDVQNCSVRLCSDDSTAVSNTTCQLIQSNCVTTGRGCIDKLKQCSSYIYTSTNTCDGLIGTDGNCTTPSSVGMNCIVRDCTKATGITNTNSACQMWSPFCVTNGTSCIYQPSSCDLVPFSLSCQGMSSCQLGYQCNDITTCTSYQTPSACAINTAGTQFQRVCKWNQSLYSCQNQNCTDFTGSQYNSDAVCNTALLGCVFSGLSTGQCIEPNSACSAFYGDNSPSGSTSCARFTINGINKCWGTSSSVGQCMDKQCSNYPNFSSITTTNNLCQAFFSTCISNGGTACISSTSLTCSQFQGNAQFCQSITQATDKPCFPAVSSTQTSGSCKQQQCSDCVIGSSPFSAATHNQCNQCLSTCTTTLNTASGLQCSAMGNTCAVAGSQGQCQQLKLSTGQQCNKYTNICKFQATQNCALYVTMGSDTITKATYCQAVTSNGVTRCAFDPAQSSTNCIANSAVTSCATYLIPTSVTTGQFSYCQQLTKSGTKCGYVSGQSTCAPVDCSQVTPTSKTDCTSIAGVTGNCSYQILNSVATCIPMVASCAYPLGSLGFTTQSQKQIYCNTIYDSTYLYGCAYVSGQTCQIKACSDVNLTTYPSLSSSVDCYVYIGSATICGYSQFGCFTYSIACTSQVIPPGLTLQQKYLYCAKIPDNSSSIRCGYDGTSANCYRLSGITVVCTAFTVQQTGPSQILTNQSYCSQLTDSTGKACSYVSADGLNTTCTVGNQANCSTYTVQQDAANDAANALYCSKLVQSTGNQVCKYVSGTSACQNTTTTDYTTITPYGTFTQKQQTCFNYRYYYAYNATNCSQYAQCSDLNGLTSDAQCLNYKTGCYLNTSTGICYSRGSCTGYVGTSNEICQYFKNSSSITCVYVNGSNCSDRACNQMTTANQASDCTNYMSSCIYDGTPTCKTLTTCGSYSYGNTSAGAYLLTSSINYCSRLMNTSAVPCTVDPINMGFCTSRNTSNGCKNAPSAVSILDCFNFHPQCLTDTTSLCANKNCSDIIATTDAGCGPGCTTNGSSCIDASSPCSSYSGLASTCSQFRGNSGTVFCYQLSTVTDSSKVCLDNDCTKNATATSDSQCESWMPSKTGVNQYCIWNGTIGCVSAPQMCSFFQGTLMTCPNFKSASDGPCKGLSSTSASCAASVCSDAPNTLTTDSACNSFKAGCMTNGNGCQSPLTQSNSSCQSLQNQSACLASKLGLNQTSTCGWTQSCITAQTQSCTASSASQCTNIQIKHPTTNQIVNCVWNQSLCRLPQCQDLSQSISSDQGCAAILSTCTTNGAGCVTKGPCSQYTNQQTCQSATNIELPNNPQITKCTYSNNQCRVLQCTDIIATTDSSCNVNGLTKCRTNGVSCVDQANLTCSQFQSNIYCYKDINNNPCLWIESISQCINYTSCNSLPFKPHQQCQSAFTGIQQSSTQNGQLSCTTDGVKCVPLQPCTEYISQASCIIGNDGQTCGYLPANSKGNITPQCVVFTKCSDAAGTILSQCQAYNSTCISNGQTCQLPQKCATYTQYACQNSQGLEGTCFWDMTSTPICRVQQCSDATVTNFNGGITTYAGCSQFPAPVQNTCTSNGSGCINMSQCSTYNIAESCTMGLDGQCIWVSISITSGYCRLKQCADVSFTSSLACGSAIISKPAQSRTTQTSPAQFLNCVSDSVKCIPKSTCSSYTNQISCQGSNMGTDGDCAFTPANATTTIGTCKKVTQCTDAGTDSVACSLQLNRCQFKSINGTSNTCLPLDCAAIQQNTMCYPLPNWDLINYTPCTLVNNTCTTQNISTLNSSNCYNQTFGYYAWNLVEGICKQCNAQNTTVINNQTQTNNTIQTTYGYLISQLAFMILIGV